MYRGALFMPNIQTHSDDTLIKYFKNTAVIITGFISSYCSAIFLKYNV